MRTHGKASTYKNHGCRCSKCTEANTAAWHRWASTVTPADASEHGTASTYQNYRCRCPGCTAANAVRLREWRAREKAS
jgi:hypothetical protein